MTRGNAPSAPARLRPTRVLAPFRQLGGMAVQTGCWYNMVNQNDVMAARPWVKGVAGGHVVTNPGLLSLAALYAG